MEKIFGEKPLQRPTRNDIEMKMDFVKRAKKEDRDAYKTYHREIPLYAQGRGDEDTKQQFYPGWTKEDFQDLQERLENEGLL